MTLAYMPSSIYPNNPMRIFKVFGKLGMFNNKNLDTISELCIANNHQHAAEITHDIWSRMNIKEFQVVELKLPESTGVIYEPNTNYVTIKIQT